MEEQKAIAEEIQPKRRLGRGLNALLGGRAKVTPKREESDDQKNEIHVDLIERNPFQPRKDFDRDSLKELMESVIQHGVLQPLLVRPCEGGYQLIAGERRWLAAKQAGLDMVPCRVLNLDDRELCEAAIEENLKRKDLNVLEKAQAFHEYLQRFESTIEELAKHLSLNRSTVSNFLRLLELCDEVKLALSQEKMTNGHARALLSLDHAQQKEFAERIVAEAWTVRKTEKEVKSLSNGELTQDAEVIPFEKSATYELTPHLLSLQEQLRSMLGSRVEIKLSGREKGKIVISFDSNEEFEHVVRELRRAA